MIMTERGGVGSGAMNNPNFVPPQIVTILRLCDIKLSILPCTSGRHVIGARLDLLPSVRPFQPVQTDPQQIELLYHCRIQLGGVVSVPRARLSPPCSNRTGADTQSGVSSALTPKSEYRQSRFCSRATQFSTLMDKKVVN